MANVNQQHTGTLICCYSECKMVQALWVFINLNLFQILPLVLPKRSESIGPQKSLCKNIHSSFVCQSSKLETASVPIKSRIVDSYYRLLSGAHRQNKFEGRCPHTPLWLVVCIYRHLWTCSLSAGFQA